jgi:hypothetical protein
MEKTDFEGFYLRDIFEYFVLVSEGRIRSYGDEIAASTAGG